MRDHGHLPIRLLVLANLFCVHVTGAVSLGPMLGLYALTLGAPFLARWRGNRFYSAIWNAAVVSLFGLLLFGAQKHGVRTMLEDGLLLAAFCQVHLLNNLGPKQKPDLVYFNAFLIAIVTSFFSQELNFGLVLMFFFPALLLALQRQATPSTSRTWQLLKSSWVPMLACFVLAGIAFVLVPRDFRQQGFVARFLESESSGIGPSGYDDPVELDRDALDATLARPVLRLTRKDDVPLPRLWRGSSYEKFSNRRWTRTRHPQLGDELPQASRWQPTRSSALQRGAFQPGPEIEVEDLLPRRSWVFAPASARAVRFESQRVARAVRALVDGTLLRKDRQAIAARKYTVQLGVGPAQGPDADDMRFARLARRYTQLRRDELPRGFTEFAKRAREAVRGRAPGPGRWRALSAFVRGQFPYALPGEEAAASDYEGFLAGRGGGHCEWFATTLTLLLRLEGTPSRLVTGFHVEDPGPHARTVIVRNLDAHAWVEVLDPGRGVIELDPTPGDADGGAALEPAWYEDFADRLSAIWRDLTSFDQQGRSRALAWLVALPGRMLTAARDHPLPALLIAALLAYLLARWRRRPSLPAAIRRYEKVSRRLPAQRHPHETPREYLARLRKGGFEPERLRELEAVTAQHEAQRYARP